MSLYDPFKARVKNRFVMGNYLGKAQVVPSPIHTHMHTHTQGWSGGIDTVMMSSNEFKFLVEPDEDLKCMICLEVARDPLQHEACGKLFCKQCLEKYGRHNPCPNCRMRRSHYYVDKRGTIYNLQIFKLMDTN